MSVVSQTFLDLVSKMLVAERFMGVSLFVLAVWLRRNSMSSLNEWFRVCLKVMRQFPCSVEGAKSFNLRARRWGSGTCLYYSRRKIEGAGILQSSGPKIDPKVDLCRPLSLLLATSPPGSRS